MSELDINEYPNELELIKFDSKDAIEQVSNYSVVFPKLIDDKIEDETKLPTFVEYFQYLLVGDQHIPTQNKFREGYISYNEKTLRELKLTEENIEGLRCRLNRVYPSLVRDIILALQFREDEDLKKNGVIIIYNKKLDLKGIDIYIGYCGKHYGLKCFADTQRAKGYLKNKQYRTPDFSNVNYIKNPLISKVRLKDCDKDSLFIYDAIPLMKVKYKLSIGGKK